MAEQEYVPANNPRYDGAGNEGLTYDAASQTFLVAQEKGPKRIVAISWRDGSWRETINGDAAWPNVGDTAAVVIRPGGQELFVLSQVELGAAWVHGSAQGSGGGLSAEVHAWLARHRRTTC